MILTHGLCIVYSDKIMKSMIKKIFLFSLLSSYIVVGILGTTPFLNLFYRGSKAHKITRTKCGPPVTSKVYWSQHKHIPSTINISDPVTVILKGSEKPRFVVYASIPSKGTSMIQVSTFIALHSSHAPPQT